MFVKTRGWSDGFLDYARTGSNVRVKVWAWLPQTRIDGLYFVRTANFHSAAAYLREAGLRSFISKVRSRFAERHRNVKCFAVGIGQLLEVGATDVGAVGSPVLFLATCHPLCVERVVLDPRLVRVCAESLAERWRNDDAVLTAPVATDAGSPRGAGLAIPENLLGWCPESGVEPEHAREVLDSAALLLRDLDPRACTPLPLLPNRVAERKHSERHSGERLREVSIVGFGNYAKTCILPHIPAQGFRLATVHEIDPLQAQQVPSRVPRVDTSPSLRADERPDVVVVAGFHHTHATVAAQALRAGAYVILEKPIATTQADLKLLRAAVREAGPRVFVGFHMRYNPLWTHAREDLGVAFGAPIDYQCIVFEEPLPRRHWYRWPNSGSRLLSNGCHWIDHFMSLNASSPVAECSVSAAAEHKLQVWLALENGATFSMALTDIGSDRIGVQDLVQARAGKVTITVKNGTSYCAEIGNHVVRRRCRRNAPYREMYRSFFERIREGRCGDDIEALISSADAVLQCEGRLWAAVKQQTKAMGGTGTVDDVATREPQAPRS